MYMHRSVLLVCLCGALVGPALSAPPRPFCLTSEASARLMEAGRRSLLDFRIGAAEQTFRQLATHPDGAVAAYYHLGVASFLQALVTEEAVHFSELFARLDTLRQLLEAQPDTRWRTYLQAEADLQRALAYGLSDHTLRAALAARSAYRRYARLVRTEADFYEPYLGLGLLHLTIASLPAAQRRFLRFFGYRGDVEQGLRELQVAAERSRYSREAAAVLLVVSEAELRDRPDQALRAARSLHEAHASSPLFGHLYGVMLLRNRRAAEAEAVFRKVLHGSVAENGLSYSHYYLARALFVQDRFEAAEQHYRRFLEQHRGPSLRAAAVLGVGLSLEMQGRREEALTWYGQVTAARDLDRDRAAARAARERLDAPLTGRKRQLLLGRNAYDAGRYGEAEILLQAVFQDAEASADERAEAAYRLGRTYHAQEQLGDALEAYRAAALLRGNPEARWGPWSQYYAGEVYAARGQAQQAALAYRAALQYRAPFDYHDALEQQAKAALRRLTP